MLCSWARHITTIVPFSNQVYKWELKLANSMPEQPWDGLAFYPGRVVGQGAVKTVASCNRKWDRLRPDDPLLICTLNLFMTILQIGVF